MVADWEARNKRLDPWRIGEWSIYANPENRDRSVSRENPWRGAGAPARRFT
jgi:hypothetical protein